MSSFYNFLRSQRKRENGFTIIELLVVVLILAVLAAIVIPIYLVQQRQAVDSSVKADVKTTADLLGVWRTGTAAKANASTVFADTAAYKAAGGKISSSGNTIIGVTGDADGNFTVCGYNKKSYSMQTPESSWYYSSKKLTYGSTTVVGTGSCDGAVDADGNDISYTGVAPVITTPLTALPNGKVGDAYTYQLTATGVKAPKITGTGVAGLTVAADGKITGSPTTAGTATLTVKATNGTGTDTKVYTFTVAPRYTAPVINDSTFPDAIVGQSYSAIMSIQGTVNSDDTKFQLDSGTLPPGMVGPSAYGIFNGTPTGTTGPTTYTFTARAYNAHDSSLYTTKTYSIKVHMPAKYAPLVADFTGSAGSPSTVPTAAATYTEGTTTYQLTALTYPAGASATTYAVAANGAVTGTPGVAGTYTFKVVATNAYGNSTKTYTGTIISASGVNGTYTLSDFEDTTTWNSNTVNGWSPSWVSAVGPQYYAVQAVSRATTPVHAGTGSLLSPSESSNGTTGDFANTNVTISGLTVGKKYTLSGYFQIKSVSTNPATGTILTSGASGFSNCTSTDRTTGAVVAKGSWGTFTSIACTASSTTGKFNMMTSVRIAGVTSNGVYFDDIKLTQG